MDFFEEIKQLDLEPVKARLRNETSYTEENLEQIILLYRAFWHLKKKYPSEIILPTYEIDLAWHAHILFTKKYDNDCFRVFGKFLHHSPAISDNEKEIIQKNKYTSYNLVQKEFPELVED